MSILPDDSKILSFGSLEEKMNREYIIIIIKRRWKREIIFGAEESKSKKTKEVYIGDQNYVIAVEKINGRGKRG